MSKVLSNIKDATKNLGLETKILSKGTDSDSIQIDVSKDMLTKLDGLLDLGEDMEGVKMLFNYSLRALCAIIRDEKNGYLNIYYKENESPHTIFEFSYLDNHIPK